LNYFSKNKQMMDATFGSNIRRPNDLTEAP
jgi:hypothetical protein